MMSEHFSAPECVRALIGRHRGRIASQLGALLNDVDGAATRDIADVTRTAAALGDCAALDMLLGSRAIRDKVGAFLAADADAEYSPVLAAVWENQVAAVKRLLAAGCRHRHAIHAAALRNLPDVIELLFSAGCPVHAPLHVQGGPKGYWPLLAACAFGAYDAAVAIVDILERVDRPALMLVPATPAYGGLPRMDTSPLHEVSGGPHYAQHMEARLPTYPTLALDPVRKFAASVQREGGGEVPKWASMAGGRADYSRMFRLLVSAGHTLNILDRWGYFPLNIAALYGDPVHVQNCLEHGADPQLVNEKGLNALEFAVSEPRMHTTNPDDPEQVIRMLVRTGAPAPLYRVDGRREDGKPQSRLVLLKWLKTRPHGAGMDSPHVSLPDVLAMNDRLVRECHFQRRKWLLYARAHPGVFGMPAAKAAASVGGAAPAACGRERVGRTSDALPVDQAVGRRADLPPEATPACEPAGGWAGSTRAAVMHAGASGDDTEAGDALPMDED